MYCSDLFSFYKEESIQENTNHISLLANISGKSKLQCMKDLAAYSVDGRYAFSINTWWKSAILIIP